MKKERLGFHIVLLGQVGAGKDTQAKIIAERYALYVVESGKYWRKMMKTNTPEGELLRRTTGKGQPTPVVLMKKFLIEQLAKKPKTKDMLFMGNPRLKPEAQLLMKLLNTRQERVLAFYITLPEKEIFKRTLARGARDGVDDRAYVKKRIAWHKEQVGKTVAYFKSCGVLKTINGNAPIKTVAQMIEREIEKYKVKHTRAILKQ